MYPFVSYYQTMWIFVLYDIPTNTDEERREAALFRKNLLKDGFLMFQYSYYIRHCNSRENAEVHMARVRKFLPITGSINMFTITDKQFRDMEIYFGREKEIPDAPGEQLEFF